MGEQVPGPGCAGRYRLTPEMTKTNGPWNIIWSRAYSTSETHQINPRNRWKRHQTAAKVESCFKVLGKGSLEKSAGYYEWLTLHDFWETWYLIVPVWWAEDMPCLDKNTVVYLKTSAIFELAFWFPRREWCRQWETVHLGFSQGLPWSEGLIRRFSPAIAKVPVDLSTSILWW